MKLPEIGVKRPVFTAMVFLGILLLGTISLFMLPKDVLPDIEIPTLTVITVYPGASANEVEQQVTKKLEEVLSGTTNLKKITSRSKENVSFITLQFQWNVNLNDASANVRDMIELVKRRLPDGAQNPIVYRINSSMLPVVIYGVRASESYSGISRIIDDQINNRLKKIPGVGTVLVIGGPTREIQVEVDPARLAGYRLSVPEIAQVLKLNNLAVPGGDMKIGISEFAVRVPGEFENVDQIRNLAITSLNGRIIHLGDVASVTDGFKDKDERIRVAGKYSVGLMVQKQSGANTLEVAQKVKEEVKTIQKTLPPDVSINELLDSSELVSSSIHNLSETIFYAGIFVILVVFLFLRNIRGSLIIILTIPISLIVAFIFMMLAGYTVNIFSLMSLAIAIGLVVDNAIVVLDNITRHIERGVKPRQAAVFATEEMGLAITASTLTIIAVFLPMVFMGGLVGIMFRQLAILTSVTLLASLATSMWLTPMMASQLLFDAQKQERRKKSEFYLASEKAFVAVENGYKHALAWSIGRRWQIILFSILLFAVTLWIGRSVGTDYIPEFDAGDVSITIQTGAGTTVNETERVTAKVEQIIREEIPEAVSSFSIVGQTEDGVLSAIGFEEGKNMATLIVKVTPPDKRSRTAREIANRVRERIEQIPEVERCTVSGGSILSTALLGNVKPVSVMIMGNDLSQMNATALKIRDMLAGQSYLANVESSVDKGKMELQVKVDQQKAAAMGLNTAMVALQVRQSIYGAEAGNYKEDGDEYTIRVRYDSAYRTDTRDLENISLTTLLGAHVPLSTVATITEGSGPLEIDRESQQRKVSVSADLKNTSLGEANDKVQQLLAHIDIPSGISIQLAGQKTEQSESFRNLFWMFVIGVLLVYMIMASQFESFRDPFIIMFTVPLSVIGVIWAFKIAGLTLSVVTFVGLIMLIGIDVNNAIILVDYTNILRKRGMALREAVAEAGRCRLRPVLMTSLIAILGMIPMAVSKGMGSEIWSPLGITCIGGLLVSKIFTIFLIPVIYTSMNRKALKLQPANPNANTLKPEL